MNFGGIGRGIKIGGEIYTPMKLNAEQIENATRDKYGAKLFDGKGLYLELHKNGSTYGSKRLP